MRSESINKVAVALNRGDATMQDLVSATGLSYPTVRSALRELHAEQSEAWPPTFHIDHEIVDNAMSMAAGHHTIAEGDGIVAEIGIRQVDNWPERWEAVKAKFAESLLEITMEPNGDVAELAAKFASAARTLSSAAYALQTNSDNPDWFEKIGGVMEQDLVQ